MAGVFRPRRGTGEHFELDWEGDEILLKLIEASRRAINDVSRAGYEMARNVHPWESLTGQLENAHYWDGAVIDVVDGSVTGEWGVRDSIRFKDPTLHPNDREAEEVTNKDVAMFLEFGTVRITPRPWLYPAWDATKHELPGLVKLHYQMMAGESMSNFRIRGSDGRFLAGARIESVFRP